MIKFDKVPLLYMLRMYCFLIAGISLTIFTTLFDCKADENGLYRNTSRTINTTITIEPSSSTIKINETVNITGTVSIEPDNIISREKFLKNSLKLITIDPDGDYGDVLETKPFLTGKTVQYRFEDVRMDSVGIWQFHTGFDSNTGFTNNVSGSAVVEVFDIENKTSGYAIIVEGRVEDESGI